MQKAGKEDGYVKQVELTISIKRPYKRHDLNIADLISDVQGIEFLGGDPKFAIDVSIPQAAEPAIFKRLQDSCDIEKTQIYEPFAQHRRVLQK
jgi:hypothetical protein